MSGDDTFEGDRTPSSPDPLRARCPKCSNRGPHRWATNAFEDSTVICARCGHQWGPKNASADQDGGYVV